MTSKLWMLLPFGVAAFFWYGVWSFCYHILHFDAVQSWLTIIALFVVMMGYIIQEKKVADDLPYTVVEEPVTPIEQGLDMEDKR